MCTGPCAGGVKVKQQRSAGVLEAARTADCSLLSTVAYYHYRGLLVVS